MPSRPPPCSEVCEAGKHSVPNRTECVACADFKVSGRSAAECTECKEGERPSGDSIECEPCPFDHFSLHGRECLRCPTLDVDGRVIADGPSRGATCSNGILTLKNSFWYDTSAPLTSETVLHRCASPLACRAKSDGGGANTTIECGNNRSASVVLCGACKAGFAMYADGRCVECADPVTAWFQIIVGVAIMAKMVLLTIEQALRGASADDFSTVVASVCVIGLNYAQGTALLAGFNLDWGSSMRAALSSLKIASGAVTSTVSFGCVMPVEYATRAYASLIGVPLLIALGPGLALVPFSAAFSRILPRTRVRRMWTTSSLVLAWLVYAAVTQEAYRVVHCVSIRDAHGRVRRWLRDELASECDTSTHKGVVLLAYLVLVGFGAAVPLALFALMRRDREPIRALIEGRPKPKALRDAVARVARRRAQKYRFLFDRYAPHAYYWEVFIMARKAALVTVLSLVPAEQGRMRVWIGLGVLQLQLVAQLVVRPYRTALQNRLDTLSLTAQFVSLFVGQAIGLEIVAPSDEGGARKTQTGAVPFGFALAAVTLLNGAFVLAVLATLAAAFHRRARQVQPEATRCFAYSALCGLLCCGIGRDDAWQGEGDGSGDDDFMYCTSDEEEGGGDEPDDDDEPEFTGGGEARRSIGSASDGVELTEKASSRRSQSQPARSMGAGLGVERARQTEEGGGFPKTRPHARSMAAAVHVDEGGARGRRSFVVGGGARPGLGSARRISEAAKAQVVEQQQRSLTISALRAPSESSLGSEPRVAVTRGRGGAAAAAGPPGRRGGSLISGGAATLGGEGRRTASQRARAKKDSEQSTAFF